MSNLDTIDPNLARQYTAAYGPFRTGDYSIGDTVAVPGTSGEVIWSYLSAEGLKYVIDDLSGFPVEVRANEVHGSVEPWK